METDNHKHLEQAEAKAVEKKPIHFVHDAATLPACLKELNSHETLAFDLEFDAHRHAYGVTLCLIQVATPQACFIIDPLEAPDMSGVFAVFANPAILKIVHSPGEDLRLLHALGCYPQNIFDTEVVARLLNYEQTSLSAMLQAKLGYSLDKGQQRSNWLRRPLSSEQIAYAAEDVNGLHRLKEILQAEAEAKGIMPFVEEEQAALSTTIHQSERKDFFLKQGDINNLSPFDQHVLNAMFIYRDELARELNRPAYQVMDESTVRDLAWGKITPEDAPYQKGIFGAFRNNGFGKRIAERLNAARAEAREKELSRKRPPRQLTELRLNKPELIAQRDAIFTPVQQALQARFGEHAARFILSNGAVTDMLKGVSRLANIKRQYKKDLIQQTARELGVDLSPFL